MHKGATDAYTGKAGGNSAEYYTPTGKAISTGHIESATKSMSAGTRTAFSCFGNRGTVGRGKAERDPGNFAGAVETPERIGIAVSDFACHSLEFII